MKETRERACKQKPIFKRQKNKRKPKVKKQQAANWIPIEEYFPEIPQHMKAIDIDSQNENMMEVQEANEPQTNKAFDDNELRVIRINHFFKKDQQIYFQVLLGRGQLIFRQPQFLPFHVLSKPKYKKMLYNYLIELFKSTLAN